MTTDTPARTGQRLTESELEDIEIGARRGNLANAVTTLLLLDNLRAARAELQQWRTAVGNYLSHVDNECDVEAADGIDQLRDLLGYTSGEPEWHAAKGAGDE